MIVDNKACKIYGRLPPFISILDWHFNGVASLLILLGTLSFGGLYILSIYGSEGIAYASSASALNGSSYSIESTLSMFSHLFSMMAAGVTVIGALYGGC